MNHYFSTEGLAITVTVDNHGIDNQQVRVDISADSEPSAHKSQLRISKNILEADLKKNWRLAKKASSKIYDMQIIFDPIDHYDDLTNIYTVPCGKIGHSNKAVGKSPSFARMGEIEHGSIPKDWQTILTFRFSKVQRPSSIISVLDAVIPKIIVKFDSRKMVKEIIGLLNSGGYLIFEPRE